MDGGITNVKALLNVTKTDVHCNLIGFSPETFDNYFEKTFVAYVSPFMI